MSFQAQAVADRIAPGFVHKYVYSLRCVAALRILRSDGHTAEDSQVVKAALRFDDGALTHRPAGVELDFPNDDARMRVLIPADEYLRYTNLLAFLNSIREIHTRPLSGAGGQIIDGGMELRIGKTLVVIESQHVVAVAGDV